MIGVNPANLVGGTITAIGSMTISDDKRDELRRHILRPGDIVFGRRGEMGRAVIVGKTQAGWLCGTGSLRLRLTGPILVPAYLKALIETTALRAYLLLASVGSTMDNVNSDIVLSAPVLIPPAWEQNVIVKRTSAIYTQSETVGEQIRKQISLLRKRRQALITAAVSGELDLA